MAHFAELNDNAVCRVIVVSNNDCGNLDFPDSEPIGQTFLTSMGLEGLWLQTSYNANFRGKFAGIGDRYDESTDTFIAAFDPPPYDPSPEES
jgi:hypothetical protein